MEVISICLSDIPKELIKIAKNGKTYNFNNRVTAKDVEAMPYADEVKSENFDDLPF